LEKKKEEKFEKRDALDRTLTNEESKVDALKKGISSFNATESHQAKKSECRSANFLIEEIVFSASLEKKDKKKKKVEHLNELFLEGGPS